MPNLALAALAAVLIAVAGPSSKVEARAAKAKAQRAEVAGTAASVRRSTTPRRHLASARPNLRDRSTVYHANGRLDGQALFDSISDRTSGAGE